MGALTTPRSPHQCHSSLISIFYGWSIILQFTSGDHYRQGSQPLWISLASGSANLVPIWIPKPPWFPSFSLQHRHRRWSDFRVWALGCSRWSSPSLLSSTDFCYYSMIPSHRSYQWTAPFRWSSTYLYAKTLVLSTFYKYRHWWYPSCLIIDIALYNHAFSSVKFMSVP